MNYLAHIFLAGPDEKAMLGALLGDFVKPGSAFAFEPVIEAEIVIHGMVDTFTDSHPIVVEAKSRFSPQTRRYAGILLDVYYDHVLSTHWSDHCSQPLESYTTSLYRALQSSVDVLPPRLAELAPTMVREDWLGSYRTFAGVERAISRIGERMSRNAHLLQQGLRDLEEHEEALTLGFRQFFPQLIDHATERRRKKTTGPTDPSHG